MIVKPAPKVAEPISQIPSVQITRIMEAAERDVKRKHNRIEYRMRTFTSDSLTEGHLPTFDAKMEGFEALMEDLALSVEDLSLDYKTEMGHTKEKSWTDLLVTTETKARTYRSSMMNKVVEIRNNLGSRVNNGEGRYQDESLQLKRQELQIQERALAVREKESADKLSETLREAGTKKSAGITKAKNKCEAIFEDCDVLSDKIALGDLSETNDLVIGRAMRESMIWKEDLNKVIEMKRSLEDIVAANELSEEDTRLNEVTMLLDRLTDEVGEAIDTVKAEDNYRELYTLDTAKTETVKLPTFEGKDDEDYAKFKELVEKAFVQNRVTRSDKLAKLREVLRGHAKKLVPFSLTNTIDDAWSVLGNAFGDPARLMQNRKEAMYKLGQLPKDDAEGGCKAQIEWYLEIEVILKSVIDLGNKSPEMYGEAFCQTSFRTILKLFPRRMMMKLDNCSGDFGPLRMEQVLLKISQFRRKEKRAQLIEETSTPGYGDDGNSVDQSRDDDSADHDSSGQGRGDDNSDQNRGDCSDQGRGDDGGCYWL